MNKTSKSNINIIGIIKSPGFLFLVISLCISFWVGKNVPPTWSVEKVTIDVKTDNEGKLFYVFRGKPTYIQNIIDYEDAVLAPGSLELINKNSETPSTTEEYVYHKNKDLYYHLVAKKHWRFWSLLPAFVAIVLCWITKEPLTSLLGGIVAGALILGQYNITETVLVENLAAKNAAGVLVLYLWLLGGLMGIWCRTGAADAFARFMTEKFVKGPKSAKLVSWFLGVVFFQGGTISTVLVGTTVKPISDKQNISHEELSYIVDSTASPIASLLAFNAWPGYIQAFIFVSGVSWLATESDRIAFFFKSIPFCFYAMFAVLGTFLLSIEKAPFIGKKMREAIKRSRTTGELDAPGANPLSAKNLQSSIVPEGYKPHVVDFFVPLLTLIGTAIGTFIYKGSPEVRWAFALAVLVAMVLAMIRGMSLTELIYGIGEGLKGVVLGSVILLLAVVVGAVSKEVGGALYLVDMLGEKLPYWLLPVCLQLLTMIISFSIGTSWGTYAVSFPLAMPLSWAVANSAGVEHPMLFMMICFAAVLDGSVYGDQCSPISDTTVLSSMCTGCDLMDHVKTQMPQATIAAVIAAVLWTVVTIIFI